MHRPAGCRGRRGHALLRGRAAGRRPARAQAGEGTAGEDCAAGEARLEKAQAGEGAAGEGCAAGEGVDSGDLGELTERRPVSFSYAPNPPDERAQCRPCPTEPRWLST